MKRPKTIMSSLVCCGILSSGMSARAEEKSAAENLGWLLGVQAYTFRAITFFEAVDKARELGVKYIEMYPGQKLKPGSETKTGATMTGAENAGVLAKLKEAGVKLVSFGVAPIPTDEAEARRRFEWAKKMGIEVLVTETTPTGLLDKLSGEYGVKIAIHNHPSTWPPDQVLEITRDMSAQVGACADIGHWKRSNLTPVEALRKLGGRVIHSHFKDVTPQEGATANFGDVPWGTGECDMRGVMAELKHQGFQGYLIIEYESGSIDELMLNLPKCMEFFNKTAADLVRASHSHRIPAEEDLAEAHETVPQIFIKDRLAGFPDQACSCKLMEHPDKRGANGRAADPSWEIFLGAGALINW